MKRMWIASRNIRVWICGLSGLMLASGASPQPVPHADDPVVTTTSGEIAGMRTADHVLAFLGVRYGESPVGARRFLPPQPAQKRPMRLPAKSYGPACIQTYGDSKGVDWADQSEDCLSLNVWTPKLSGKKPVMVWIHGGGNWQGSSRDDFDGAKLAATGDAVIVTINYRLGLLGFVDVSELGGANYATSPNNGLQDQLLALDWVKKNIARFGGDPGNVTVFGNSAGSTDISALLATDAPGRLFNRAILQSGFANTTKSREIARRFSHLVFEKGAIRSMDDLLAKTPQQLVDIQNAALEKLLEGERDLAFQPTMDGQVVKDYPLDRIRQGHARKVDLILGTTLNEMRLYLLYDPQLANAQPADMMGTSEIQAATRDIMWKAYRGNRPGMTDGQVTLDMASDYWFRLPAIRMAEAQLKYNPNVYMYLFDWQVTDPMLGSPHAVEVPFVFGDVSSSTTAEYLLDPRKPDARVAAEKLSGQVQQYWTSFARNGRPVASSAQWPGYDLTRRLTMEFAPESRIVSDPASDERTLFEGIPFDGRK